MLFSGKLFRQESSNKSVRKMIKKKMLSLLLLSLSGCVSTTEELIKAGDWYQVGYQDGVVGRPARTVKELSRLGQVQQGDYDQGYLKGVTEYCNPEFAYQIGLSGQYYEGVCEGTPQSQQFRMEWQRGWDSYND
ncbi:hypothetical protein VSA01S_02630 [Vibrio sagamiensis NBRC 104589]|uniref:Uncharacterized protein n=1 Tax=Vibrio sagamiensis NBRC 104589 TaxID=1219064 RepID=A0A511QA26_9VIBR|nr:hypothetical protein VSA01S_02630 [Vibrio sagamiensis NBRC 104589]